MNKLTRQLGKPTRNQQGAVLIISLIFLVVLTLIVVSSLRSATSQERMAANARNEHQAFEAAEAVLRDAQITLFAPGGVLDKFNPKNFSSTCANGLCSLGTDRWKTHNWASNTLTRGFSNTALNLQNIPQQPRYFVEMLQAPSDLVSTGSGNGCEAGLYNVTARAVGRDSAVSVVQQTFKVKPSSC
jgi:type IV pilus assembly protein PilX